MKMLKLMVPTYLANVRQSQTDNRGPVVDVDLPILSHPDSVQRAEQRDEPFDFGAPHVPVLVCEADGVRVVLGTHNYDDLTKPDLLIERRPNGWAIFLHPLGGSDPSGYVYFLDDGRSFLLKEHDYGPTETIEILEQGREPPEVDTFPASSESAVRGSGEW